MPAPSRTRHPNVGCLNEGHYTVAGTEAETGMVLHEFRSPSTVFFTFPSRACAIVQAELLSAKREAPVQPVPAATRW